MLSNGDVEDLTLDTAWLYVKSQIKSALVYPHVSGRDISTGGSGLMFSWMFFLWHWGGSVFIVCLFPSCLDCLASAFRRAWNQDVTCATVMFNFAAMTSFCGLVTYLLLEYSCWRAVIPWFVSRLPSFVIRPMLPVKMIVSNNSCSEFNVQHKLLNCKLY